jgi:hypothetical protein
MRLIATAILLIGLVELCVATGTRTEADALIAIGWLTAAIYYRLAARDSERETDDGI